MLVIVSAWVCVDEKEKGVSYSRSATRDTDTTRTGNTSRVSCISCVVLFMWCRSFSGSGSQVSVLCSMLMLMAYGGLH